MDGFKMRESAEKFAKGQNNPPRAPCKVIEDHMEKAATKCKWMDDHELTGAILLDVLDIVQKPNTIIQRYYKENFSGHVFAVDHENTDIKWHHTPDLNQGIVTAFLLLK